MSTWGGIGEGLAAGMNRRIDIELQERERRRQQANADRQFEFQQEQARRAQANADRQFEAGREDAARSQANADRQFEAGREDAARSQANTDRAFAEGVRRADMAQANADRQFEAGRQDKAFDQDIAAAELEMKRESADWQNRLNSEKVESFKLQNQQLMDAWNKQKEKEDLVRRTGRNQLAQGIYTMQSNGDQFEEGTIQLDGKETKVRVMPPEMRDQIFGSEGPLSDIANMFIIDTDEGRKIGFQRNGPNGPTTVLYGDGEQYDILRSGIDKDFADGAMSAYVGKRDVGLKIAEAEGKAMATERAKMRFGESESIRSLNSLFQTGIKEGLFNDDESREIAEYALGVMRKRQGKATGGGGNSGDGVKDPAKVKALQEEIRRREAAEAKKKDAVKRPVEKKSAPAEKPTEKNPPKAESKKTPSPTPNNSERAAEDKDEPLPEYKPKTVRRRGENVKTANIFAVNEDAVVARKERERQEEEKRRKDREEFYERMKNNVFSASRRRN